MLCFFGLHRKYRAVHLANCLPATKCVFSHAFGVSQEAEFPDGYGLPTYSDSITAVVGAACLVFIFELIIFFVRRLPNSSHKAPQGGSKTLDATESATQNMAPRKSSLQQEGPSEEKVKAVDVQEMRTCIQRSGGSRRTTTTGSPKGASRAAPQRTS